MDQLKCSGTHNTISSKKKKKATAIVLVARAESSGNSCNSEQGDTKQKTAKRERSTKRADPCQGEEECVMCMCVCDSN